MIKTLAIFALFSLSLQSVTIVASDSHSTVVTAPEHMSTVNTNNINNLGMTADFGARWITPLYYEKPNFPISATYSASFKGNCMKPATLIITSTGKFKATLNGGAERTGNDQTNKFLFPLALAC